MKLHELSPAEGSVKENFRKGRGAGSGNGKTAGKGHKGQNARSGGGVRPGFEGGQLPLYRKLPKRGFNNSRFAKEYTVINLDVLERLFNDGDVVDAAALLEKGAVSAVAADGVKVLAKGNLTKNITVKAAIFSAAAKEKIEAVGGKTEVV
ncbi:MAG: 50S ribosomal protein L15 [Clostridia bacterium]|nr:50S ribosomal protein L15 [Clostridia bacterium]